MEVSAISKIEVLGFPSLTETEQVHLEGFFRNSTTYPVTEAVIEQAVKLRQRKKMTLGDSIIAATALCHKTILVTRNTSDFDWIDGLELLNPIDQ